jgi:mRNA-degrading endonuclease RelE of RelBE toxin-antitoxin system
MAWRIEFEERAAKDLEKLDPPVVRRILGFQQAKPDPSHCSG